MAVLGRHFQITNQTFKFPFVHKTTPVFKILIVTFAGISLGSLLGIQFTKGLARFNIYNHVPEDEEADVPDLNSKESSLELTKAQKAYMFGDHRLTLSFLWKQQDLDTMELMRQKIVMEIEDLDESVSDKETLSKYDVYEINATRAYLIQLVEIYDKRERDLKSRL